MFCIRQYLQGMCESSSFTARVLRRALYRVASTGLISKVAIKNYRVPKKKRTPGSCFFSERELTFTFAIGRRPSVCRLSVTLVHPTQAIEIFGIFLRHFVPWPPIDIQVKFYEDRPRGTPPSGELNKRGVAEYSDFGSNECYISKTVQDRS